MPPPFEFSIYLAGLCGLVMIGGAIWLLRTGAIKLSDAAQQGNVTVEILEKIKINTNYPALFLFIIGLGFIVVAIWFSRPDFSKPMTVFGKLDIDDPTAVTVRIEPENIAVTHALDSTGYLSGRFHADFQNVMVIISAAGHSPPVQKRTLPIKGQQIPLPSDLQKFTKDTDKPPAGNIEPLPPEVKIAPLQGGTGFQ